MLKDLQKQLQAKGSIRFKVKIIPKSQRNEIVGTLGEDILKIRIAATPVKNKANEELVSFLSDILEVPKSQVTIVSGPTSPLKIIDVQK